MSEKIEEQELTEKLLENLDADEFEEREELDVDHLLSDFSKWLEKPPRSPSTRLKRFMHTLFVIGATTITYGGFLFVYMAFFVFKFYQSIDLDDYRKTIYVKKNYPDEKDEVK